ncbi:hypothetical protein RUND412_006033 [Rhizina undulata]
MSSHPSSGTMLPPAVRYAKIFGTIGAGVLAGTYYTHSAHTLPALLQANSTSEHITKTFKKLHDISTRPFLYLIVGTATSLSYAGYYLYNHPLTSTLTTTTFSSGSLIPSTTTDVHQNDFFGIAGEWMFFALPAVLVGAVVPYSKFVMKKVSKSVLAAGTGQEVAEGKEKMKGVKVTDDEAVKRNLEAWRKLNWGRAGMCLGAAAVAGAGVAGAS